MKLGISNDKDDPKAPPPYLTLYHLTRDPFSDEPDPAFFYADPVSTAVLASLRELDETSTEVLLISGAKGAGKSTLVQQFLEHAADEWRVCHLQARKGSGEEFLLDGIRDCFGLETSVLTPEQQLENLQNQLSNLQQELLPVLVIDDAHLLGEEALYLVMQLAEMTAEQGVLMRVILFAEYSLDTTLTVERFADFSQPRRFELTPLDELQTAIYLNHRLQVAGYAGRTLFSNSEVKQIHRNSQGIASRVNEEAHHVMMLRWQAGGRDASSNMRRYLKIGGTVAGGILLVLLLQRSFNSITDEGDNRSNNELQLPEFEYTEKTKDIGAEKHVAEESSGEGVAESSANEASEEKIEIPMTLPPAVRGAQQESSLTKQRSVEALTQPANDNKAEAVTGQTNAVSGEETPLVVKSDIRGDRAQALNLTGVEPSPVVASDKPQRLVIKGTGLVDGSRIALNRAGAVTLLTDGQVEWISNNTLSITVVTGKLAADWAVQVGTPDNRLSNVLFFKVVPPEQKSTGVVPTTTELKQLPESPTVATKKSEGMPQASTNVLEKVPSGADNVNLTNTLLGSEWLARQPLQNYTLQLLASNSKFNVTAFVREHSRLMSPLASIATEKEGSRYYLLVQGSYATREAADQAAKQLPDGLDSWPRTIESVRQGMVAEGPGVAGDSASTNHTGVKDIAWVWSQDPNRFTVQLAAAESEASIESVTGHLDLPGELVVVQTMHEGRHWYVLIYGSFASKEAAHTAISHLPASLQKTGPWPRSFASLQSELSKATP